MTTDAPATAAPRLTLGERFAVYRTIINTANLPEGMTRPPDAVAKWLVITRAAVFSMTATSGLIGGLLAIGAARLTGEVSVDWGLLILAVLGLDRGARRQQHDQRLLRPLGRGRHRGLRPRPVRAPSDPVGLGHEAPAGDRHPCRQRHRPGDHALPGLGARAARHRLRAGGALHQRLLRRAADPAQAHRPRRAGRLRRLGTAHGGRHVLRRHRRAARLGLARLPAVRDPRHHRAVREAHRQDRGR